MTNEEYQIELEIAFQVKEEIASLKAENKILKMFYEDFKQALILPVVGKSFCDYCSEELKEEKTVWVCQDCRDGMT